MLGALMSVYRAINAVQRDLSALGISKDRKNAAQGYAFRGIDDVYNALAPLLSKHGLCILPRILERDCVERATAKGGVMFYVTVAAEFDFVSAEDGSKHVVRTYGEAMDSADKATNKAMSAAYKYAAFQAFSIPTEGDNDADAHTPPPILPQQSTAPISQEQYDQLSDLMRSTHTAPADFLRWLNAGVESVAELPAVHFCRAKAALEKKAEKTAKEATDGLAA